MEKIISLVKRLGCYSKITLVTCALLLLTLFLIEPAIVSMQTRVEEAKQAFLTATFHTQTQLVDLVQDIGKDTLFIQNIQWNLNHSMEKSLEASLRPGEVDELFLFASDCLLLAKASLLTDKSDAPCRAEQATTNHATLNWVQRAGLPALVMHLPLKMEDGRSVLLVGMVVLDKNWLLEQPKLKTSVSDLALEFKLIPWAADAHSPKGLLAFERLDNHQGFALLSKNPLLIWFSGLVYRRDYLSPSALTWIILLLLLAQIGMMYTALRRGYGQTEERLLHFRSELSELTGTMEAASLKANGSLQDLMMETKQLLLQHLEHLNGKIKEAHSEQKKATRQIHQLEADLKARNQEIEALLDFKTLGSQINLGSSNFLKEIDASINNLEDISDILVHGLNRDMQTFYGQMQNWQNGIQQRGLRRFVRSISESVADDSGQKSVFEDELENFMKYSDNISNLSVNLSMKVQSLLTSLRSLSRIAEHWQKLAQIETTIGHYSVLNTILAAQTFFESNIDRKGFRFTNVFAFSENERNPPCPQKALQSAITHIYMALRNMLGNKVDQDFILPIRSHITANRDKASLIIHAQGMGAVINIDFHRLLKDENFILAQTLLTRYSVHCELLPKVGEDVNIALSWDKNSERQVIALSNHKVIPSAVSPQTRK